MDSRHTRMSRIARMVMLAFVLVALAVALSGCGQAASGSAGGNAQTFSVDLSTGAYSPNSITAKVGTPISITFGRPAGCLQTLVFPAFNIHADLTHGPKTFDLGVLKAGDYPWSCGMNMQHGVLHVE
jgi:Cu+-exporting ATPase